MNIRDLARCSMLCIFCGKNLNPDTKFCSYCGRELPSSQEAAKTVPTVEAPSLQSATPAPPNKPVKRTGRSLLFGLIGMILGAVVLASVLFFTGMITFGDSKSSASGSDKIEGPGYDTPEDAAKAYLEALKNQDVDAMVATFAVESYVENYDLEVMCERLQAYAPSLDMKLPTSNDYNNSLDVETRKAAIISQIEYQYFIFNVSSVDMESTLLLEDQPDIVSNMEKETKDYVFADLEITGTMEPEDLTDIYSSESNQKTIAAQVKPYGVDEKDIATVIITFDASGKNWYFCPQLIRYEGKWYVQTLSGNLAGLLSWQPRWGGMANEG